MPEIAHLRGRAAHYRLISETCDSIDKRVLLKIAQDFDDEAGRAAETRRKRPIFQPI